MTIADLVITGARVITMDGRPASAVAVRDGRICAVGDDVGDHIGRRTQVIDGSGRTVTPGLVDSHQHPVHGVADMRGLDLTGVVDLGELRAKLRAESARLARDEWLIAYGLEYNAFRPDWLHRKHIDDAIGDHPALLTLIDAHTALMNTRGLQQAGITGPVEFADRSEVVLDPDGTPTGELHETLAVRLGDSAVPPLEMDELARRVTDLHRAQNAVGITGAHMLDLAIWPGTDELFELLDERGDLTVRTVVAPWCLPGTVDDTLEIVQDLRNRPGRMWRTGAIKFFLDGVIDGGSAWLCHPDSHGQGTAPVWREARAYAEAVQRAVDLGLPCWTHAIGDKAVSYALDTYAAAGRAAGGRHRIEHVELLQDADVTRFAELDVVASMQPTHMDWTLPDHSDNWSERIGEERCGRAWRYRDVLAAGGHVALGSDWPIAGYDPREIMAGARLRRPVAEPDRAPVLPEQALSAQQVLAGYTTEAAYGAGEEQVSGRIRVGMRADLAVFDGDPLTCAPEDLPELPVACTIVDGRIVHEAL
ncbi:amidohydrolase [Saccharopolyspora sp. NPDC002686]|uniref:amidohydrolase n=1 Tax=Saccharopolyspora sp. NPDC002686 TaxID=3154541 RepID=UPI003318BBA8